MIEFKCQVCGKFLKMPQSFAGQMIDCPTCRKPTRVPGAPGAETSPIAPKPTGPDRKLCVDCGKGFPAGQMLVHNGQAVCTDCYHLRKPVELKPRPRRKKSRKRTVVIIAAIIAAAALGAWAVVHWAL
jgi:DNA-directed RNA polymerase subunit RPC12/RpoP